ncbi:hypothetical protein EUGRSUZ_A02938 [Eucalyptus grandis]|uniref:Uncharacterized protein n=2 Tax=Eucalyptus grandis TaxID=71139 RepID=A0ACC3M838_EUCGR|nr:hypothetical protein EUGRSUZ_A02938 [Eucalyptus grandis]
MQAWTKGRLHGHPLGMCARRTSGNNILFKPCYWLYLVFSRSQPFSLPNRVLPSGLPSSWQEPFKVLFKTLLKIRY